jgi:hypothetical protein
MEDRRKLERFDLHIPATIELLITKRDKELIRLLTKNVCSGGAYFHTTKPLPKNTQIKIDLVLPLDKLKALKDEWKHALIKVTGKVLRSEPEGMAICFDEDYQIHPWKPE